MPFGCKEYPLCTTLLPNTKSTFSTVLVVSYNKVVWVSCPSNSLQAATRWRSALHSHTCSTSEQGESTAHQHQLLNTLLPAPLSKSKQKWQTCRTAKNAEVFSAGKSRIAPQRFLRLNAKESCPQ